MFRFANIDMLWLLLLVPLLAGVYMYVTRRKRRQLRALGDEELVSLLMPDASHTRPTVKFVLALVALTLLILASARPQAGEKTETVKRQGIEVMIALDISNSMLAEDIAPNRLDRAKQMLSKMIDKMTDDKVGLVVFAGEAYTQLPITCDYVSAKMFLSSITPSLIPTQGTAIGAAIRTCVQSFGSEQSEAGRAIILLTDAENHEDDAVAAAKQAAEKGIQVFVVGVGKTEGAPIPIPGTGTFHKDKQGQVVVSRLNEAMANEIAQAGNGIYVRCDNTNTALRALQKELDKIATAEIETQLFTDYQEQYQSFLLGALLLLLIDFFLLSRQNRTLSRMDLFNERKVSTKQ
ncbi:MAG: VWA domain-containing protein [Paludibacteraceae bacterium]|nr:VWA domain-containing protein [Paludibacteraceae bacterium]